MSVTQMDAGSFPDKFAAARQDMGDEVSCRARGRVKGSTWRVREVAFALEAV